MKRLIVPLLLALLLLAGCAAGEKSAGGSAPAAEYHRIDQETARQMLAQEDDHVLVDVRRSDEYFAGHIPGAICIPNESIGDERPGELPNPGQTILIYCRTGNRSQQAAQKLAALGYTRVYDFGGIVDWTGETVSGQTLALTLEANPTTGFSWAAVQDPALFAVQSYYTAEPQTGPVSGAGGWQTLLLTPEGAGTVQLTVTYSRPWEPHDADPQFTCAVEVGADLSLTVTRDGTAEAAAAGFRPVIRIY